MDRNGITWLQKIHTLTMQTHKQSYEKCIKSVFYIVKSSNRLHNRSRFAEEPRGWSMSLGLVPSSGQVHFRLLSSLCLRRTCS